MMMVQDTGGILMKSTWIKKAGKTIGTIGNIFSVLDTVKMVEEVSKHSTPLIDKAIERHYASKKDRIFLSDVVHMSIDKAKDHLEGLGLVVAILPAKQSQLKKDIRLDEVVHMVPKPGFVSKGSLVKLYVVTAEQTLTGESSSLPNLKGMFLEEAASLLEESGFKVARIPLKADRKYYKEESYRVISSDPKNRLFSQSPRLGVIIRLFYLDDSTLQESRHLEQLYQDKVQEQKQTVIDSLNRVKGHSRDTIHHARKLSQVTWRRAKILFRR